MLPTVATTLRRVAALSISAMVLLAVAPAANATGPYEEYFDRKASEILPPEYLTGPYHRVKERVVSYGFQHFYEVESDFGPFKAQGDAMLRRLVREIYAISALEQVSGSEAFIEGTKGAIKKPFQAAGNLLNDPVDTISGVPEGVFSIFERVGERFDSGKSDYEDSGAASLLAVSSFKREFSKAHGIDVYSTNSVLQSELNRIGWASAAGNLGPGVAMMAASGPVAAGISAASYVQSLNDLIYELPPSELSIRNRETLEAMAIDPTLIDRFLEQKILSPRHKTIIVESLATMADATNRGVLLEMAITAESEIAALFFQQVAETMAGYHRTVAPAKDVANFQGIPIMVAGDQSILVALPADRARWTQRGEALMGELVAAFKDTGRAKAINVWITGTYSDLAKEKLAAMGVSAYENADLTLQMMD